MQTNEYGDHGHIVSISRRLGLLTINVHVSYMHYKTEAERQQADVVNQLKYKHIQQQTRYNDAK